jgi:hypothetical protein
MLRLKKLKDKKCKHCKKLFSPSVPLQYICSPKCAIEAAKIRAEAKEKKDWSKRKKEGLEKLKTLSEYEKEARIPFQKYIRERDRGKPCISCGVEKDDLWQGSHYFKAEIFSGLIFDERNCHKSCLRCNLYLNGNELGYREGLVKRYGEQYVKDLEIEKDPARNYKYSKGELLEIKKLYKAKLKEL